MNSSSPDYFHSLSRVTRAYAVRGTRAQYGRNVEGWRYPYTRTCRSARRGGRHYVYNR